MLSKGMLIVTILMLLLISVSYFNYLENKPRGLIICHVVIAAPLQFLILVFCVNGLVVQLFINQVLTTNQLILEPLITLYICVQGVLLLIDKCYEIFYKKSISKQGADINGY